MIDSRRPAPKIAGMTTALTPTDPQNTYVNTTDLGSALANIKPRLKLGVFVITRADSSYVGRMDAGIEVFAPARIALASCDGARTCIEIAQLHALEIQEISELILALDNAHLLDTHTSKITVHERFHSSNVHRPTHSADDSNDGAYQQLQAKLTPELSFTTWLADVKDGGVETINTRRDTAVNIYGDSRIAVLIFGILLASGVTSTRLISKESRTVTDADMGANFLQSTDIGFPIQERLKEHTRDLSLFPVSPTPQAARRSISVCVGPIPAEKVQEWLSSGTPHFFIDNPDGASITLGPLVIPGRTPCLRCVAITKDESHDVWKDVSWHVATIAPQEVPVSVAHYVAGLMGLEILRFIDEGKSSLFGATDRIDYHNPRGSERRIFARHPACGCNW